MKKLMSLLLIMVMLIIVPLAEFSVPKVYASASSEKPKNNVITGVAATQDQLNILLETPGILQIVVKPEAYTLLSIPEGDYSDITLLVTASNMEINNNGIFKAISIQSTDALAWDELASGNSFEINSSSISMDICKASQVDSITLGTLSPNKDEDISSGEDTVDTKESIACVARINTDGKLTDLIAKDTSRLDLSGYGEVKHVLLDEAATDSQVVTSIDIKLDSYSNSKITVLEGADDTEINLLAPTNSKIENLSDSNIDISWVYSNWRQDYWTHSYQKLSSYSGLLITPDKSSIINKLYFSDIIKVTPVVTTDVIAMDLKAGQPLSCSMMTGIFKCNSIYISGEIKWLYPQTVVNKEGEFPWVFIPKDETHYNRVYGVTSVKFY